MSVHLSVFAVPARFSPDCAHGPFFGKRPNAERVCSLSVGASEQIHFLIKDLAWMVLRLQECAQCHSPCTLTPTALHLCLRLPSLCRGSEVQPRSDCSDCRSQQGCHIRCTGSSTRSHTTTDLIIISAIHMQQIHRVAYAAPNRNEVL